jgi:hypothetical protein
MIRGYDYKPEMFNFFGGDPSKDLMIGIELDVYRDFSDIGKEVGYDRPLSRIEEEMLVEGRLHDDAYEVEKILNCGLLDKEYVYVKRSPFPLLCSFTIVSHLAVLEHHLNAPWEQAFRYLIDRGYRSEMVPVCGLRVHINKAFFGETPEEVILGEERLLYFFEKHWDKLEAMSRRDKEEVYEYCARRWYTDIVRAIKDVVDEDGEPKLYAVDFNKKHSVEVRLFKGTLTYRTFVATLTLVAMIAEYCKYRSVRNLVKWRKFEEFLQAKGDINAVLIDYMKERCVWD